MNIQAYLPLTLDNNLEKPLQGTYAHMFKMDNIEYICENKRDQYPFKTMYKIEFLKGNLFLVKTITILTQKRNQIEYSSMYK